MHEMIFTIKRFIDFVINIYTFIIILRAIISWVNPDPYNPLVRALYRLTEPILYPIRKAIFRVIGYIMIDFSPFVAILLIQLVRYFLFKLLNIFL